MKNYIKTSVLIILSIITFSCDNDIINDNIEADNLLYKNNDNYSILQFPNMKNFRETILSLEKQAEVHDDIFIASYPHLNADELTHMESEVGFNLYEPFIKYEEANNFQNSMFKKYRAAEKEWLRTDDLNMKNDPDITFLDLEPEELVLLNDDGAVKIGNDIYLVLNGAIIIFNNIDINTFSKALDNSGINFNTPFAFEDISNDFGDKYFITGGPIDFDLKYTEPDPIFSCTQEKRESDRWSVGNNKRLKGVVKVVNSWLWGKKIKSKSKYYKKYVGVWIKNRASSLTAAVDGVAGDICGSGLLFTKEISFIRTTNKSKAKWKKTAEDLNINEIYVDYMSGCHRKGGGDWKYQDLW